MAPVDGGSPGISYELLGGSHRLSAIVALLRELDDDEMRMLPLVVGEQILERERRRARELLPHVGKRCDVIWAGQAELWDVALVAIDADGGVARVQRPGGRGLDVPALSVIIRH